MLEIIHGLEKLKQYLVGVKLLVKMDHNKFKYILNLKNISVEQQKWDRKFQYLYFEILYKKGKENQFDVILSRK